MRTAPQDVSGFLSACKRFQKTVYLSGRGAILNLCKLALFLHYRASPTQILFLSASASDFWATETADAVLVTVLEDGVLSTFRVTDEVIYDRIKHIGASAVAFGDNQLALYANGVLKAHELEIQIPGVTQMLFSENTLILLTSNAVFSLVPPKTNCEKLTDEGPKRILQLPPYKISDAVKIQNGILVIQEYLSELYLISKVSFSENGVHVAQVTAGPGELASFGNDSAVFRLSQCKNKYLVVRTTNGLEMEQKTARDAEGAYWDGTQMCGNVFKSPYVSEKIE